jgi:aminocarboxymuconate-semialdehyde decarboxylase
MAGSAPAATLDDGYTRVVTKPANKVATRMTTVGGKRVRVIDVHAHVAVADSLEIVKGTPAEKAVLNQLTSRDSIFLDDKRLEDMDANGIDIAAVSVNSYWDRMDKSTETRLLDTQNARLAELSGAAPDRFQAFASVAMQYPDVAVKQLEHAIGELGLCGVAIGASIADDELADPKFDPFWAKAEELQALVFIHPQRTAAQIRTSRLDGLGALPVVLGHPFETAIGLAHLIFEGTLDRFPDLKICAAHGGGLPPSYPSRMDYGCQVFPKQCEGMALKKKPSEYLRQLYFDTLVFTPENIRHLAPVCGAGQLVIGTDYPTPWVDEAIDPIMETPGLSDAERIAILGGTAARLLKLDG